MTLGSLLLLYYLAWRFQSVAAATRMVCQFLGRQFALLAFVSLQIATACRKGYHSCRAWPKRCDKTVPDENYSFVGATISRLVILAISLCILLGELPLARLRT